MYCEYLICPNFTSLFEIDINVYGFYWKGELTSANYRSDFGNDEVLFINGVLGNNNNGALLNIRKVSMWIWE